MQIIKNGEIIDLIEKQIEIENTSPIFSTKGSQSVSTNFPKTPKNLRLFGFPNRIDRCNKIGDDEQINVADGALVRSGIINVTSVGEYIEASIGFDESEAYAKMGKTKLSEMDNLPVYVPPTSDNVDSVQYLINTLSSILVSPTMFDSSDFGIFPVITTREEDTTTGEVTYQMILNETKLTNTSIFEGETERTIRIKNGNEFGDVLMPKGFGISPFIKLHVLLKFIWEYLGFELVENPFATDFQLRKICILNNTWDTIVTGKIDYKDLMPDCTIEDVMSLLWGKFGAVYFVNTNTKTVRIILIRDILRSDNYLDYSSLKSRSPTITIEVGKQLKFSCGRSGTKASTAEDTYEKFLKSCQYIITELPHDKVFSNEEPYRNYIYTYDRSTGNFYNRNTINNKITWLSSSFFDWDREVPDLEYEEIKSPDEALPVIGDVIGIYPAPFLTAGENYLNTTLRLSKEVEQTEGSKASLSVCFALHYDNSCFGSLFGFDPKGETRLVYPDKDGKDTVFSIDLIYQGKYGIVHNFFEEYMDFKRHANQLVTQDFLIPAMKLSNFDFSAKILVDGQFYLPENFTQIMGEGKTQKTEMKMRSLKLLKPYDLDSEHGELSPQPQLYYWKFVSYHEEALEKYIEDNLSSTNITIISKHYQLFTKPNETEFNILQIPTEKGLSYLKDYEMFIMINYSFSGDPNTYTDVGPIVYKAGAIVEEL